MNRLFLGTPVLAKLCQEIHLLIFTLKIKEQLCLCLVSGWNCEVPSEPLKTSSIQKDVNLC